MVKLSVVQERERQRALALSDPYGALERLAAEMVEWQATCREHMAELDSIVTTDVFGVEKVRGTVEAYERSLDRTGRILTAIAKLDIADRKVQLLEAQAAAVVAVIDAVLAGLALTPEQVRRGEAIAARELRALSPTSTQPPPESPERLASRSRVGRGPDGPSDAA